MEAITQVMEATQLPSIFDIPDEMRYGQVEITIRTIPQEHKPKVNMELLNKFRNSTGFDFKEHLQQKLAEGYQFDFDAQKIIDSTMTEDDWQDFYKMEKGTWGKHVANMAKEGEYD
jgi:hypothetical protein